MQKQQIDPFEAMKKLATTLPDRMAEASTEEELFEVAMLCMGVTSTCEVYAEHKGPEGEAKVADILKIMLEITERIVEEAFRVRATTH